MSVISTLSLASANILLPIAVLVFATGFFPYKPFLPGLTNFEDAEIGEELGFLREVERPQRVFEKVVFMVVDALRRYALSMILGAENVDWVKRAGGLNSQAPGLIVPGHSLTMSSDFVFGPGSGFEFTQRCVSFIPADTSLDLQSTSLIRSGQALPFTAHATSPTITMPRVKALTTGSVPSFLDVILNFAESDTTSSLALQDTWLAQVRANLHNADGQGNEGRLVFYGDDTWLKLFPSFFAQHDGTSSFFVSDFTEVDNNVTRHLPSILQQPSDWDACIMHYLGLDHIGHKAGPQSPNMRPKQREMDGIVREIFTAMESQPAMHDTLLVLVGDHGMNSAGNHGGSAPGETSPALVFASPKFKALARGSTEAPTTPKPGTDFDFYRTVEQSDIVPSLAALLGVPVPRNNLGVLIPELLAFWPSTAGATGLRNAAAVQLLYRNALQVLGIVTATFGDDGFRNVVDTSMKFDACGRGLEGRDELSCKWALAQRMLLAAHSDGQFSAEELQAALTSFLAAAQDTLSTTASSYDLGRLAAGTAVAGLAAGLAMGSLSMGWLSSLPGKAFVVLTLLYGVMMFASSYVEEEQHFWYWTTGAWMACLAARRAQIGGQHLPVTAAAVMLLALHRICMRWNQTGQKLAGEPDIARTFLPRYYILLWLLVIATYIHLGIRLVDRTLAGILPRGSAIAASLLLMVPAFVFKLNFTQADAPELVQGLAVKIRDMSAPFDLVVQARAVFVGLALMLILVVFMPQQKTRRRTSLAEQLHDLLAIFLVTQTRVQNVPLFLIFEMQFQLLVPLQADSAGKGQTLDSSLVTLTSLLVTQTSYFCMGGSNAISSIDLSNAYNGVSGYNVGAVGVLLFCSNWAGPIWWSSAAILMLHQKSRTSMQNTLFPTTSNGREWVAEEREKLRLDALGKPGPAAITSRQDEPGNSPGLFQQHIAILTVFVACSLVAVMAACTALRTHLFIWTVFSPKYLYAMAWSIAWHLLVNIGLGGLLHAVGRRGM